MSRPVSSPNTVTIALDQPIDQASLSVIKRFKNSLGPNDRVLINNSGNTTIYTQHTESASEKFIRKLGNFEKNVKAAWSHVSDLFSFKNQGNGSEATKNVKDTTTHKSTQPESSSISVKKFNLEITPYTNTCIIPVLGNLDNATKDKLKDLEPMIRGMNLARALDFFSTGPESLAKVEKEFAAFLQFAQAQGRGESVTHQNRDAINFANRWAAIPPSEYKELKARFGESYLSIFNAAFALAAADKSI